ncbi:4'-phosphopantetheinyl transferase family protein [Rhodohalobacter sp. 614A]|uniref:4'-phosphopantetheinyl transferase family protein n=1 Tax=Rhodohalobacter sp. 614A TaxID=2908649 RepID=UPI001F34D9B5|nr:4'-phosphopantetheinyl transferase superfamily protein [Rhodohalobacter sp. 614A]
MKSKKLYPIRLDINCLPKNIYVSYESFEAGMKGVDSDLLQNQSGRDLIRDMAVEFLEEEEIQILTQKNEKPKAICEGREVSVSFSHTKDAVAGAISFEFNVGCDMENIHRNVHDRLINRMKHIDEKADLYEKLEPVQVWTLKEAALKMIGTGLRKPMKSVRILMKDPGFFDVEFDDGKRAKICSFQHKNHWISVCYHKFPDH